MQSHNTALITGISGQDGRLLAERLLIAGYRVVGVIKPGQAAPPDDIASRIHTLSADLTDSGAVVSLLEEWKPGEIYHLAAVHHSTQENSMSAGMAMKGAMLVNNFLTTQTIAFAMMQSRSNAHLVFAGSSQMYTPQSIIHEIGEKARRDPPTFYGLTKSWGMELLAFLRAESALRASTAILFNHESPLRAPRFVSRKITQAAASAKAGARTKLELLNIGARVDWSGARDVVAALHSMAQADSGGDYIVASGRLHSVREMLEIAFGHVDLDWRKYTVYQYDVEEPALVGLPHRLRETLGWQPRMSFQDMITEMVEHDLRQLGR